MKGVGRWFAAGIIAALAMLSILIGWSIFKPVIAAAPIRPADPALGTVTVTAPKPPPGNVGCSEPGGWCVIREADYDTMFDLAKGQCPGTFTPPPAAPPAPARRGSRA